MKKPKKKPAKKPLNHGNVDHTHEFMKRYSDEIQRFCEDEGLPFEEVWYIGSNDYHRIETPSPLFDFDEDEVSRSDEKEKLDMIRDLAIEHYEGKCVYCAKTEKEIARDASPNSRRRKLELDHFLIPFSKKGQLVLGIQNNDENVPILSNCVVACPSCNSKKKNRDIAEFMRERPHILLDAIKLNATFTSRIKEIYEAETDITKKEYMELIFERLNLDRSEIESEIERRYPGCTLEFHYGHAPSFDPKDAPGYSGGFIPHAYQYEIVWHLVEGGMDSYDADGNLKEASGSIIGEEAHFDPFSAGYEIKKAWQKWLIDNPAIESTDDDDLYDPSEEE